MRRYIFTITAILLFFSFICEAQKSRSGFIISGKTVDAATGEEIAGVAVNLEDTGIWTTTDEKGRFILTDIAPGTYSLDFSCLGYVDRKLEFTIRKDISELVIKLSLNTLALNGVVVTAELDRDGMNTSTKFGSNALEHLQMSNVTDIAALLPGGRTVNPDLTADKRVSVRSGGLAYGNASFGTALEVDGIRVGNNASFGEMNGYGTRNISTENVQSIEVITGVPSAEYGDLNSGIVRINTKKGRTPLNVTFSVNPRTYQASASKGIDLQNNSGVLNLSAEWTRATQRLSSPYTSYSRRGFSASYSNTFRKVLKFEAGFTGNIGGMNAKNDPDAYQGTWSKGRDNVFRGNTSLTWLLQKSWITNLKFDASVNFNDNISTERLYSSSASMLPAAHSEQEGYYLADRLPMTYFADRVVDSKELDYAASLKYEWFRKNGGRLSKLKAGVQWKANGNVGEGEYYKDPSLAANGYRPRSYSQYPFMHNLAVYAEEDYTLPIGKTKLELAAGLRLENLFVKNTKYENVSSLSPRFNFKWKISDGFSFRGGWGVSEKLPSFYILYPVQKYRDIQTFGFSHGDMASYVYYTQPYKMLYNENLKWQRSSNSEFGIDAWFLGAAVSLVGFYNKTANPYTYQSIYTPFSYNIMSIPEGFEMPENPQIRVDSQTGQVYMRATGEEFWTPMETKVTDYTFCDSQLPSNGADIHRAGVELTVDFPEIAPILTKFRLDANYAFTRYVDNTLTSYYKTGWSHTELKDRSYQYVGIYASVGNAPTIWNGKVSHSLDANLTAVTHIPQARIVITCRLEMSVFQRFHNLSEYNGSEYAYCVQPDGTEIPGKSIYSGTSYTAIRPVKYIDETGAVRDFTDAEAANPAFANLILRSGNAYTFAKDGYGSYLSANLSVTKEIGDHVSISFYANNFTNSRMSVKSRATGVSAIFTPTFYYGLTCRLKF
ncbi:MAG: TonB-dependent receptor [Bacteroidales bacterium]|nr:TonB-dependent receptor [Bacteroidales bacterium]